MSIKSTIQKWLEITPVSPEKIEELVRKSPAFLEQAKDIFALQNALDDHKENHSSGGGSYTDVGVSVWANSANHGWAAIPQDVFAAVGEIGFGRFGFYAYVTDSYNLIPGGHSQDDNPVFYIVPDVQPQGDGIKDIVQDVGSGMYYYRHDYITYPCVTQWVWLSEVGKFGVRLIRQNFEGEQGKKPISKWNYHAVDGKPLVTGGGDVLAGTIPFE